MDIRILGAHNSESDKTRLTCLLVDDCLAIDVGGLTSGLSFEAQWAINAVLLTHRHYDHIRDILALAMNFYLAGSAVNVYASESTCEDVVSHLFDGKLYPNFLETPEEKPTVRFTGLEPDQVTRIEGYDILPVEVDHSVPTVGYQVTSPDGKTLFYTADTGPGLDECWKKVSPQLLIIECTATDKYIEFGKKSGHITPTLLKEELISFRDIHGYIPQVVTVHMSPRLEDDIRKELATVSRELEADISLGYEGMELHL